jgi:hypothetical protein
LGFFLFARACSSQADQKVTPYGLWNVKDSLDRASALLLPITGGSFQRTLLSERWHAAELTIVPIDSAGLSQILETAPP